MKHLTFSLTALSASLLTLSASLLTLSGCSGSSAPASLAPPTAQTFGPLTTRIVGAAQAPVTSSRAYGANVTAIAGALVDQLTLNFQGPKTLNDTKIAFISDRSGSYQIYTMNTDGTGVAQLTNDAPENGNPSWSPDGSKIVFTSGRDGNYEIYVMNADGTNQTRLTNNGSYDFSPSWSPDGSKIAFTSTRDGNYEIYVMNANGTNQTRLTDNAAIDERPSWSPDGSKIAFTSDRDANYEIYTMNTNGTGQTRLTDNEIADEYPSWSPDGSKIAFSSDRDGNYQIYTMNTNGTGQTRLTNDETSDQIPSWSPDGSKIAFTSYRDGNYEIGVVNTFGGSATNLTKLPSAQDDTPSWSGYLPRMPKTLIGSGGALGTAAAGFLFGQNGDAVTTVVAFDTTVTTLSARAAARVVAQTAAETEGNNLIFNITTTVGLASVSYAPVDVVGAPGTAVSLTIPTGSTNALVSFNASTGLVSSVIPYAANRSQKTTSSGQATYTGKFTAVFDADGKNLAPGGARSVTLDEKTGKLVRFE